MKKLFILILFAISANKIFGMESQYIPEKKEQSAEANNDLTTNSNQINNNLTNTNNSSIINRFKNGFLRIFARASETIDQYLDSSDSDSEISEPDIAVQYILDDSRRFLTVFERASETIDYYLSLANFRLNSSKSNIDTNITILFKIRDDDDSDNFKEDKCIVCLEPINKKELNLSCSHNNIHYVCLAQWMETQKEATCPQCRRKIVKEKE